MEGGRRGAACRGPSPWANGLLAPGKQAASANGAAIAPVGLAHSLRAAGSVFSILADRYRHACRHSSTHRGEEAQREKGENAVPFADWLARAWCLKQHGIVLASVQRTATTVAGHGADLVRSRLTWQGASVCRRRDELWRWPVWPLGCAAVPGVNTGLRGPGSGLDCLFTWPGG